MMPILASTTTPTRPSAAMRPLFLAALASPFLRSQSTAASISPPVSVSAFLQSIMPAPVRSRSSFTSAAEIVAIVIPRFWKRRRRGASRALNSSDLGLGEGASDQGASLLDPAIAPDAAVELEIGVELARLGVGHGGDLPIVEHAVVVELLDDLRADARQLGEIVGRAARRGEELEMLDRRLDLGRRLNRRRRWRWRRQNFSNRRLSSADINSKRALTTRNAVEGRLGDEIAIGLDCPGGVVVPRNGKRDAVGIGIGVEDRCDRYLEAVGL